MTIGGVPPIFHKPWFINPGLTLFQEFSWTGSISLGIPDQRRGLPMDLPEKAKASEAISDVSTCGTNSRATDGFNDASDDDLDASDTSATWLSIDARGGDRRIVTDSRTLEMPVQDI